MSAPPRAAFALAGLCCLASVHAPGAPAARARESAPDAGWPQWRGPEGTGAAPGANPPAKWSETENIRWKVKLPGSGTGTPIVWNDRVFIQAAVPAAGPPAARGSGGEVSGPTGPAPRRGGGIGGMRSVQPDRPQRFTLMCLDRRTGKKLWEKVAREELPHESHHADHGFSSHSPVTDGRHVYAYFGSRGLYCYDFRGTLKWGKDLGDMRTRNGFGEGSSPALFGGTIVVNWDHEGDDFIVALDKETGRERWRRPRDEATSWSTPLVVKHGGRPQVVVPASRRVCGYDLGSGRLLWESAGLTGNVVPTPVAGHGMVYVTSGFRGNALLAIRLGRQGDLTGTDAIAWSHNRATPYVPSPLLYGTRLYFIGGNTGILSCFDAPSGRPLFSAERVQGLQGVYASPVGAGGRVYLLGREGGGVVIRDGAKLEVLATNRLDDRFDASPAVVGNEMFLRGHHHLYCVARK